MTLEISPQMAKTFNPTGKPRVANPFPCTLSFQTVFCFLCVSVCARARARECVREHQSLPIWFTVRTKRGPLEEGMANDPRILAATTAWIVSIGQKILHWKMSPPGWRVRNMLLGKSGGQLLIAPEIMKWLGQSRNDTQLWMCLVMKVKSNVIKNSIA